MGTGIAPLQAHPVPTYPGYTPPPTTAADVIHAPTAVLYGGVNSAVGLRSVGQLSLSARFSGSKGMTEVYNLVEIDRITNHLGIPGNKKAGVSNPWTGPVSSQQSSIKL